MAFLQAFAISGGAYSALILLWPIGIMLVGLIGFFFIKNKIAARVMMGVSIGLNSVLLAIMGSFKFMLRNSE